MTSTKQVRLAMRRFGKTEIWTNKTDRHTGTDRRVKCYFRKGDEALVELLKAIAGDENVKVTEGSKFSMPSGVFRKENRAIIVKCQLPLNFIQL